MLLREMGKAPYNISVSVRCRVCVTKCVSHDTFVFVTTLPVNGLEDDETLNKQLPRHSEIKM